MNGTRTHLFATAPTVTWTASNPHEWPGKERPRTASAARPLRGAAADRMINHLASGQHGVVTRPRLVEAGVPPDVVDRRIKSGWLEAIHRGVYRVGPVLAPLAREMAAVLACRDAAVSHVSVLPMSEVAREIAISAGISVRAADPIHVTTPRLARARHGGIVVHGARELRGDEVMIFEGIPVTTPARTLFDLAAMVDGRRLEQLVASAMARGFTTRDALLSQAERHVRRPGSRRLRLLLEADAEPALTRSEAEARFLALVRSGGLPTPRTNVVVCGYKVDFVWEREGLIVEVDGRAFHSSDRMFESDRRRDRDLTAAGFRVIRVTWRQLVHEPNVVLVQVTQALMRNGIARG
jgi:very-short-patch-repair endonuclease/predicted transcriptional regulator of viral defense system